MSDVLEVPISGYRIAFIIQGPQLWVSGLASVGFGVAPSSLSNRSAKPDVYPGLQKLYSPSFDPSSKWAVSVLIVAASISILVKHSPPL